MLTGRANRIRVPRSPSPMTLPNASVWQYRAAVFNLALLRLRVRYNNSALGFLWSLGNPLFFMLVFTFVFTVLLNNDTPNYPVFVLSATMPWNFFNTTVLGMMAILPGERELITKLSFPREILPFSVVIADFINFAIGIAAINLILIVIGQGAGLPLLALPLVMLILTLFACGLGLLLATINIWLRDMQEVTGILLFGWFFVTPIVYSLDVITRDVNGVPLKAIIQVVNPMAGIISMFRQVIYSHEFPDSTTLLISGTISVILFAAGLFVFRRLSPRFAEEV